MNISFLLLGVTMIGGALLLRRQLVDNHLSNAGFIAMVLGGLGTILVGLFPENTISGLHILGAALPFVCGNTGMIALGISLKDLPPLLRGYSVASGLVGLIGLVLLLNKSYLGLGIGGMERIVSYPQSIWMIIFGIYVLSKRSD